MSTPAGSVRDRIAVIDASGEQIAWVSENYARDLIKAGQATCPWRRRGKMRQIVALNGFHPHRIDLEGRGTGLDHTRYSTTRESETNPPRVWALLRLGEGLVPMRG